jgi:hypothetical protein
MYKLNNSGLMSFPINFYFIITFLFQLTSSLHTHQPYSNVSVTSPIQLIFTPHMMIAMYTIIMLELCQCDISKPKKLKFCISFLLLKSHQYVTLVLRIQIFLGAGLLISISWGFSTLDNGCGTFF